jgi:hypothetical protein
MEMIRLRKLNYQNDKFGIICMNFMPQINFLRIIIKLLGVKVSAKTIKQE